MSLALEPDFDITQACTVLLSTELTKFSMEESKCSIYRVHSHLRNVNPTAYEPEVVAIGPYHRGKDELKMMEDHKLRYLHLLLESENEITVEKYVSSIAALAPKARKCYAEPINLGATEFIKMLVLDGCFIIELVRRINNPMLRQESDPIFRMGWIFISLQRDLMLFENQIPFFVLQVLFDLIEVPNQHDYNLTSLLLSFFSNLFPGRPNRGITGVSSQQEIKHLLHLIHCIWLPPFDGLNIDDQEEERFINSVAGLREANVKFEKNKEEVPLFDIRFENGTMRIPPLRIEDRTEAFFRNLITYEQYADHGESSPVRDYVKFLDCLVDSSKDVEILSRLGILKNWLGDDEVVAKMVNKLNDLVTDPGSSFIFAKLFQSVKGHCEKRRNRWMAKLRRNYLNSPWAIISIVAAVLLLLLTVTQTVFTTLQVV